MGMCGKILNFDESSLPVEANSPPPVEAAFPAPSKRMNPGEFPGGPVVETLPSNVEGVGSVPGQGAGIPHASQPGGQGVKQKQC